MATPYLQLRLDTAPSTQDVARDALGTLPVLVIAGEQTAGRGRGGSSWLTAPRALAASLALRVDEVDRRPFSLIAGVAAVRANRDVSLKWPNDVIRGEGKAGGILVERSGDVVVIGMGLNLFWPDAPSGHAALNLEDPGPDGPAEVGGLWGAELMRILHGEHWPIEEYRAACETLGREIVWEPNGSGVAIDVADDGGLVVETASVRSVLYSGEVRHVRPAGGGGG